MVPEDKILTSEAEGTVLNEPTNKVTGLLQRSSIFVAFINIALNFAISFKKEVKEKFIETQIVDIMKSMMTLTCCRESALSSISSTSG